MKKYVVTILKLILIAIFIGLFITFYQYVGHLVIDGGNHLLQGKLSVFIVTILISLAVLFGVIYINKLMPGYYGSGIPQIEAYHRGWYDFSPIKMLVLIIVNSFYAFFTGFLLGSEGPSISIGTSIARIHNKIFDSNDKEASACGGSAGFACAFMSPLAGLCHLIEENRKMLSWSLLLKGLVIIGISFIVCYLIYQHSLLPYFDVAALEFKYYWLLLPLILACILISKLYIFLIIKMKDLSKKANIMIYITPLLLVTFMILKRFHPILIGNGGALLDLNIIDYSLLIIFGILLFRLIGTALSVSSYVSGGVVLPMLAVGALVADILVKLYVNIDSNIINYTGIFIICGMLVVFAVVTKAPLTAFVLGLKCAPFTSIILPLLLTVGISGAIAYLLKWDNIYHQLERRLPGYSEAHA